MDTIPGALPSPSSDGLRGHETYTGKKVRVSRGLEESKNLGGAASPMVPGGQWCQALCSLASIKPRMQARGEPVSLNLR